MELELWAETSAAISAAANGWERPARVFRSAAPIAGVYHWAALHDRPVSWACRAENGRPRARPERPPDQSTLSRRTRRKDFMAFPGRVGQHPNGNAEPRIVKVVDGKPLEPPDHTKDPDATRGRGVSRTAVGYKPHAVFSGNPMPDAFAVTTLGVCGKKMAGRMVGRPEGFGHLPGDAHFDAGRLFDECHGNNHQSVRPRAKPGAAEGHHYVSPHRRRATGMLEVPRAVGALGHGLHARRTAIERDFSRLTRSGAGLGPLPAWIRRIRRVRHWATNKLLVNAARIRINRRKAVDA